MVGTPLRKITKNKRIIPEITLQIFKEATRSNFLSVTLITLATFPIAGLYGS